MLAMHALLPLLKELTIFVKLCQLREIYIGDLMQQLKKCQRNIQRMYLEVATKYSKLAFPEWHHLVHSEHSILVWSAADPDVMVIKVNDTEFELTVVPPAEPGQRGRRRTESVTDCMFKKMVQYVQDHFGKAARLVLEDLIARFPNTEVLEAFSILYPRWWAAARDEQEQEDDFLQKVQVISKHFCEAVQLVDGTTVRPPLDGAALENEAQAFVSEMRFWVNEHKQAQPQLLDITDSESEEEEEEEGEEEAEEGGEPAAKRTRARKNPPKPSAAELFFRHISNNALVASQLKQWLLLAELVFVMVPGSVEEERMFSAMKFLKNPQRNRLTDSNLTAAARLSISELASGFGWMLPASVDDMDSTLRY